MKHRSTLGRRGVADRTTAAPRGFTKGPGYNSPSDPCEVPPPVPDALPDIAPWDVAPSPPGVLHLRLYEGGGWLILAGLVVFGLWGVVHAIRGDRRRRAGRIVASAGAALIGVACAWFLVRQVDVFADGNTIRWAETRLPGRVTRQGEMRVAELAEVLVGTYRTRSSRWYRVVLRARDGTEQIPDDRGDRQDEVEALAATLRAHLAAPR